jgi:hypothetical protein
MPGISDTATLAWAASVPGHRKAISSGEAPQIERDVPQCVRTFDEEVNCMRFNQATDRAN